MLRFRRVRMAEGLANQSRTDGRHLIHKANTWYATLETPVALRRQGFKRRQIESLHTGDLAEAQRRKHAVLAKFQAVLDAQRGQGRPADDASSAASC